jgi:hypothetical protein
MLSTLQCDAISKELAQFAGQRIDIISLGAGPEGERFAVELGACLKDAKWKPAVWTIDEPGILPHAGLYVAIRKPTDCASYAECEANYSAALSLIKGIKEKGIMIDDGCDRIEDNLLDEDNVLRIGANSLEKPEGIGQYGNTRGWTTWTRTGAAPIRLFVGPRA